MDFQTFIYRKTLKNLSWFGMIENHSSKFTVRRHSDDWKTVRTKMLCFGLISSEHCFDGCVDLKQCI